MEFRPTLMAKHIAWTSLGVKLRIYLRENVIGHPQLFELIKDVTDPLQRQKFIDPLTLIITSDVHGKEKEK